MYEVGSRVIVKPNVFVIGIPEEAQGEIIEPGFLTDTIHVRFDNGKETYVEPTLLNVIKEAPKTETKQEQEDRQPTVGCRILWRNMYEGAITARLDGDKWQVRLDNGDYQELTRAEFWIMSWPRKREEDQVIPIPNGEESSHDVLIREVQARKDLGLKRYGTLLQPHNGRDSLQDAIEEAIDLLVYLIQVKRERDQPANAEEPVKPCKLTMMGNNLSRKIEVRCEAHNEAQLAFVDSKQEADLVFARHLTEVS